MIKIQNYIDGELRDPSGKAFLDNVDPSTGEVFSQIPNSTEDDVNLAVAAAQKAFPKWSSRSINYRAAILEKLADLIRDNADSLAQAECLDNGKPLSLSTKVDIPRAEANIRFFARAVTQFSSESHRTNDRLINYTLRKPIGIVGCISPWNLPLYLFTWKIAPALATGCTVVAKPSEVTPYTAFLFTKLCKEAGLPDGVLNVVHGLGAEAGNAIVCHPDIKAISFTGGTKTGATIASIVAPKFKKASLELGGKNPNLIFADCDYEKMLDTTIRSSFANQGQICLCGSRIFVERPIYEKFKKDFVERTKALIVGDPKEEASNLGAVVSKAHMEKVLSYIDLAKEEGGDILCGGHQVKLEGRCANGYFIAPTIIEGLAYDCRTNQEEIFGPVVTIMPFDKEEEVLAFANSTVYGLASTVWTSDLNRAHRIADKIEAGIVWINCWLMRDLRTPFGGMKASGVGREGGLEALRFFTEPKNVCIQYG